MTAQRVAPKGQQAVTMAVRLPPHVALIIQCMAAALEITRSDYLRLLIEAQMARDLGDIPVILAALKKDQTKRR